MLLGYVLFLVLVYLVAAFPFGLAVAVGHGVDPRQSGSCNTGATNVARLCGTRCGVTTLALDLAKGLVPVLLARIMTDSVFFLTLTILAAVAGHMFSVFLDGKGGKGVATTIGVFLGAAPLPILIAAVLCLLVIKLTGYVSAGSLVLAVSLPFLVFFLGPRSLTLAALIVAAAVVWKHRENITRLRAGQEKSWRKGCAQAAD